MSSACSASGRVADAVTSVRRPEYGRDTVEYDATTGNRLWEENPAGNRVQHAYYATSHPRAPGLLASVRAPGAAAVDSVVYDPLLGNVDTLRTPLAFRTTSVADVFGRDTLTVSPVDSGQTRLVRQSITYDQMDRVTRTLSSGPASPYLKATTQTLDSMWAQTLDVQYLYDAEGNRTMVRTMDADTTGVWAVENTGYDLAGRATSHTVAGTVTTTTYDPAGNPLQVTTPRATIALAYDALNRLTSRVTPAITYAQVPCTIVHPDCRHPFPLYPNDGGTGLLFPADTARFTYDVMGRVLTADNGDARIRRTYARNGSLLTDSVRIRNYSGTSFSTWVWGLAMRYDSLGRRVVLKVPASLAGGGADSLRYTYHPQTGALQEVRDLLGNRFVYSDDAAGRQTELAVYAASNPSSVGVRETRSYDEDSWLRTRLTTTPSASPSEIQRDSLWYDGQGKVVRASYYSAAVGAGRWDLAYAGLGGVIFSQNQTTSPLFETRLEEWRRDQLGNPFSHSTYGAPGSPLPQRMSYDVQGRLLFQGPTVPPTVGGTSFYPDSTSQTYDAGGNVHYRTQHQYQASPPYDVTSWVNERHYYGADDRLRVVQRVALGQFPTSPTWDYPSAPEAGVWEEYRYDALGRRVLVRARRDVLSTQTSARSTLDRLLWDGNQLLYEHRIAGGPSDALDGTVPGPAPSYGLVGYIHGHDLDAPLALMDGRLPLATWRGAHESSVWATGQPADCSRNAWPCDDIDWPETRWSVDWAPWLAASDIVRYWRGSLIQGSQDGTGLLYRRNRYCDPQTGRFTQEGPIGLAGGLNLHGLAGGDPVNFSDPFGFCTRRVVRAGPATSSLV